MVFVIESNLLLPCFGLSALYNYMLTPDPACWPGITAPPYTKHGPYMVIVGSILNEDALPHPLFI